MPTKITTDIAIAKPMPMLRGEGERLCSAWKLGGMGEASVVGTEMESKRASVLASAIMS